MRIAVPVIPSTLVLGLAVLSACALTPRQQCEFPLRNQLANLRADIRDSELMLKRGFRLVPATSDYGLHYCVGPGTMVTPCFNEEEEPMYDKRPINRPAEAAKLETLRAEQRRLERALAACAQNFPE